MTISEMIKEILAIDEGVDDGSVRAHALIAALLGMREKAADAPVSSDKLSDALGKIAALKRKTLELQAKLTAKGGECDNMKSMGCSPGVRSAIRKLAFKEAAAMVGGRWSDKQRMVNQHNQAKVSAAALLAMCNEEKDDDLPERDVTFEEADKLAKQIRRASRGTMENEGD